MMCRREITVAVLAMLCAAAPAAGAGLNVTTRAPEHNSMAQVGTTISVTFDKPLLLASVTSSTFRVFGRGTGTKTGSLAFSNSDQTVTLTPTTPFSAGEVVLVNLSSAVTAADASTLQSGGYAYQFVIQTQPAPMTFVQIDEMSNRIMNVQTRIYGAMATDLNHDGYIDLNTVNEVSADLRVFLNKADGTGLYHPILQPPFPIGDESSPNEQADFDNDGDTDAGVSSTDDAAAFIVLGNGNGTFGSSQSIAVGSEPHGIAVLDVDGDADLDVVIANHSSSNLALMINNGSGVFGAATFFDSGCAGEYALASGDMNGDGIVDLIVGCRDDQQVVVDLGNGNGTFTPSTPQGGGGLVWQLVVGDVDGDGVLDVTTANSQSNNGAILLGNGDGTLAAAVTQSMPGHTVATDLGDLDGDGDLDWVLSSFGGLEWHVFRNNGSGTFTSAGVVVASANPSCAVLLDFDNDGDLDMALTDEIADTVKLMRNQVVVPPPASCAAAPLACRTGESGKGLLWINDRSPLTSKNKLKWKFTKGAATTKAEYGNPLAMTDDYALCIYNAGTLVHTIDIPGGGQCGGNPCWKESTTQFSYADKALVPDGKLQLKLREGLVNGATKIFLKGKGSGVPLPDLSLLTGTVDVQLQKSTGLPCWGATYSTPLENNGTTYKAKSD
jgi:hypothetical protein